MSQSKPINWRAHPMWRLLLPFLAGLVLADQLGYFSLGWWDGLVCLGFSLLLFFFLMRRTPFEWRHLLGFGLMLWMLLLGYLRAVQTYAPNDPQHLSVLTSLWQEQEVYLSGRVSEKRLGTDRLRLVVNLDQLQVKEKTYTIQARVAASVPANSLSLALQMGQRVALRGQLRPFSPPTNPAVFDYSAWQARRQIFHQLYLNAEDWQVLDDKLSLRGWAEAQRARLLSILHKYLGDHPNEYAVAAALVLGKRDAVSRELRNAYAETGAVHVLAVSGLHLGFVLGALHLLLGWGFWRKPRWRWPRLAFILLGIWLFALLTGLAPSVLRAATMFSFLEVGRQLQRKASTYNALAASAFLLLLIDPQLLFNVGFQLSYLAVLGILFFQPRIERAIYFKTKLARKAWALIAVALAAQLTTFPLSLYYFHQFPVYFLLTGLFVVLLAAGILYLAVGVLLLSWWSAAATILAKLLYLLLFLNNALIFGVQQLPFGLIRAVWISGAMVILLYLAQLLFARWLQQQQARGLIALLSSILVMLLLYNWEARERLGQNHAIIYDLRRASAVDWLTGSKAYSSMQEVDNKIVGYQLTPYREKHGLQEIQHVGRQAEHPHLWRDGSAAAFRKQRWLIVDEQFELPLQASAPLEVELVWLRQNPRLDLADLRVKVKALRWVADASNAPWRVKKWLSEADSLDIKLHYTPKDGAFVFKKPPPN